MIVPLLQYKDAPAALDWLEKAFGFTRVEDHRDEDGNVVHAELTCGDGMVMVSGAGEQFGTHHGQGWCYVVIDDADAHHARAVEAGAEVVQGLTEQEYGSRDYSVRDPEGNLWSFGTYRPALRPSSISASPDSN